MNTIKHYADLLLAAVGVAFIAGGVGVLTTWPVAAVIIGLALLAAAVVVPPWA